MASSLLCRVSANVFIVKNNKILLVQLNKRGRIRYSWGLPGGKVDKGESSEEGMRREVFEETGIRPEIYTYKRMAIFHDYAPASIKHLYEVFLKEDVQSFVFPEDEICQVKWFDLTKAAIEKIRIRSFPMKKLILDYIDGKFKNISLYTQDK